MYSGQLSLVGGYRKKEKREIHARERSTTCRLYREQKPSPPFLDPSRLCRARLVSLAQIGELARRLEFMPREHLAGSGRTVTGLARLVERLNAEQEAAGSIPCAGPIFKALK